MLRHQKMLAISFVAAAGLFLAAGARAQTPSDTPHAQSPAGGLNLTQAQRDEIRALREAQRKELQPVQEKLRAARQQLREAMRADVPDESAIRSAAGAVAAVEADRAVLRARARGHFMSLLTPEQRAQVKEAQARVEQRARRMRMRANRMMWRESGRDWR